jgi:hypothetical protein
MAPSCQTKAWGRLSSDNFQLLPMSWNKQGKGMKEHTFGARDLLLAIA